MSTKSLKRTRPETRAVGRRNRKLTSQTELRDHILSAALTHIPFDGWTERALAAGAVDAGLSAADARRAFADGAVDAIAHFSNMADRRMIVDLEHRNLDNMSVHQRAGLAIRLRLEAFAAHRDAIRRSLAFLAMPGRQIFAMRLNYRTVDAIWYAIGDRSTDFNFYTKRALLGSVYAATVLYWLGDESDGATKTWEFLDRRLADVVETIKARRRMTDAIGKLISPLGRFVADPGR